MRSRKSRWREIGQPTLIALAYTIERARKTYYDMLERSNKVNAITEWLTVLCDK